MSQLNILSSVFAGHEIGRTVSEARLLDVNAMLENGNSTTAEWKADSENLQELIVADEQNSITEPPVMYDDDIAPLNVNN